MTILLNELNCFWPDEVTGEASLFLFSIRYGYLMVNLSKPDKFRKDVRWGG